MDKLKAHSIPKTRKDFRWNAKVNPCWKFIWNKAFLTFSKEKFATFFIPLILPTKILNNYN